ncbi:MAG: SRPBCC family protein [Planctomycetota bacterium]
MTLASRLKSPKLRIAAAAAALAILGTATSCAVYNFETPVGFAPGTTAGQRNELQRTTPRPQLRPDSDHVWVEAARTYDVPPDEFWRVFRGMALDELVEPNGELPAIVNVVPLEGQWHHPNARRRVELADGHSVIEQLLTFDAPRGFTYILWNFTSEARHGVEYATGRWYVTPVPEGTHVLWRYGLAPRSGLTRGPVADFASGTFLPFMQAGLENIAEAIEAKPSAAGP